MFLRLFFVAAFCFVCLTTGCGESGVVPPSQDKIDKLPKEADPDLEMPDRISAPAPTTQVGKPPGK
jgi:hypothetical protein